MQVLVCTVQTSVKVIYIWYLDHSLIDSVIYKVLIHHSCTGLHSHK